MDALKLLVAACALMCWIALGLIYHGVETVMGTGPIVLTLGALTAWQAKRRAAWRLFILGVLHMVIAFLFFWLVQSFSWSPAEATEPFKWMGRAYTAGWSIALLLVLWPRPAVQAPEMREALRHVSRR